MKPVFLMHVGLSPKFFSTWEVDTTRHVLDMAKTAYKAGYTYICIEIGFDLYWEYCA